MFPGGEKEKWGAYRWRGGTRRIFVAGAFPTSFAVAANTKRIGYPHTSRRARAVLVAFGLGSIAEEALVLDRQPRCRPMATRCLHRTSTLSTLAKPSSPQGLALHSHHRHSIICLFITRIINHPKTIDRAATSSKHSQTHKASERASLQATGPNPASFKSFLGHSSPSSFIPYWSAFHGLTLILLLH